MELLKKKFNISISSYKDFIQPTIILFLVYVLSASAILRANFYYIDDIARANQGYKGWATMSRYVSVYLSSFIHADSYLADVSPLTQFIALFIVAVAAVIAIYVITDCKKIRIIQIIAAIPLGVSPYFLECISYKYDSPYMAISILAGIIPLLFRKRNLFLYTLASVFGILLVCMSYQAALGIYPILVIILATRDWNRKVNPKEIIKFVLLSVISYGIGIIIFKLFIMQPVDTYVSDSIWPLQSMASGFITNLKKYYNYVLTDFKREWLILISIISLGYLWRFVYSSKQNKFLAIVVGLGSFILMAMLAFGIYPALMLGAYGPRAMYGYGALISFLAIAVCSTNKKASIAKIASIILSWCFVVFSFTYGNALYVQAKYTDYNISMIAESLGELDCVQSQETVNLRIRGDLGFAKPIKNMPSDYGMLRRLVPITLRENWWWGSYGLLNYYGLDNLQNSGDLELQNPIRVEDNAYYSIDVDGQNVVVTIK